MKRGGPLRRTPFRQGKGRPPAEGLRAAHEPVGEGKPAGPARKPIRARSVAATKTGRSRATVVRALIMAGVRCEIGPELARHGIGGCTGTISGLHERRKRSSAGSLVDARNTIPCCNACNLFVETEPGMARLFGTWLVLREGDPEWAGQAARGSVPRPPAARLCARCGAAYVTVPPSGVLGCGHTAA